MPSELHRGLGKKQETEQMLIVSLSVLYRYTENPSLVVCKFFPPNTSVSHFLTWALLQAL